MGIQREARKLALFIDRYLDDFLNLFSLRQCFACRKKLACKKIEFYCETCFQDLRSKASLKKKYVFFKMHELNDFFAGQELLYPKIFYFYEYDDLTKKLMRDFKYSKPHYISFWQDAFCDFWLKYSSQILVDADSSWVTEEADSATETRSQKRICFWVNPIPMHHEKLETRVYNQAELLTDKFCDTVNNLETKYFVQTRNGLCQSTNFRFEKCQLLKRSKTESLFDKSKLERLEIMKSAFSLDMESSFDFQEQDINVLLIVDDITTSGATFMAAQKTLNNISHLFEDIIFLAATGLGQC